jgi:hypothetical protein
MEIAAENAQNDALDSAISRASDNILKMAMLIEIGKSTPSHIITEDSISIAALLTIDFFLPSYMQIMGRLFVDIRNNKIEKAISVIQRMGGSCTRSTLIKNGHFTKKECDEIVESMLIGEILIEKRIKETKSTVYVLTTESKPLEIQSEELNNMFRTIRKLRTIHSFAMVEKNVAKSAKSDKEIEEYIDNHTYMCEDSSSSSSEVVKFAKSAKSAKLTYDIYENKFKTGAKPGERKCAELRRKRAEAALIKATPTHLDDYDNNTEAKVC